MRPRVAGVESIVAARLGWETAGFRTDSSSNQAQADHPLNFSALMYINILKATASSQVWSVEQAWTLQIHVIKVGCQTPPRPPGPSANRQTGQTSPRQPSPLPNPTHDASARIRV